MENMTSKEFFSGEVVRGIFCVSVRKHKMFNKHGPALVGFFIDNLRPAIARYHAIFKAHVPEDKPLFSTNGQGKR